MSDPDKDRPDEKGAEEAPELDADDEAALAEAWRKVAGEGKQDED